MAATEDELAKQKVQEAVWQWTGRLIVLAVTFGFGFFAAFILWGAGINGAPALRILKEQQEAQILERKNKEVDLSGKLTVIQSRLEQCITDLQKARAAAPALRSSRPAAPRKRGSLPSSGRPIASARRRKMRFVATAITTQPSRARKQS